MAIVVQVNHVSSLRRICDLEWRARASDLAKMLSSISQTIFTANLMGIAWTVSEIIKHLFALNIINAWCINFHVSGSHRAKFDDYDFNSFRGIACEGHRHTQRQIDRLWPRVSKTISSRNRLSKQKLDSKGKYPRGSKPKGVNPGYWIDAD